MESYKEKIKQYGNNIMVLEEEIDLKLQTEYLKESAVVKKEIDQTQVLKDKNKLFDDGMSLNEKRKLLTKLASINEVEAFRTLEAYRNKPDKSLMEWSVLAYQESKMLLQSTLMDKPPLFISTGLGGKGMKLRYFVVIKAQAKKYFTDFQQQIIIQELDYAFNKNKAELEDLRFFGYFATITALVPLETGLKKLFADIIKSCNEMGDFVDTGMLITNSAKPTLNQIKKAIDSSNKK
ncbi:hypothetical protein [Carboxylicivirga linearis]|uniref:Uncharacterized protein n=1 Tax=Carboxylicivirga linearis TaxID=1628157 RepID=A0ABS5JYQ8_9BACT|nr:hypothetical protein [Carboxylicivirga linearis]MBS2100045.1 hypothetical protein [Carboxylicivirga linearis]